VTRKRICSVTEIADPGTCEFVWGEGDWPLSLFLVRLGGDIHGYVNRCPHAGHELNLMPNEFLTADGELLMCRSHGARFRPDDGFCVLGPCPGTSLDRFTVTVEDGDAFIESDELDALWKRFSP
jgi:nitrite reductase/ring-hydroxylating ferredoxin subunit